MSKHLINLEKYEEYLKGCSAEELRQIAGAGSIDGQQFPKRYKMVVNRLREIETNAFLAVHIWFPDDKESGSKASLGLVTIYHTALGDHWRAIAAAQKLRQAYSDQTEQCAQSLSLEGWSYYMLKMFEKSRRTFEEVIEQYPSHWKAVKSAQRGLSGLDVISSPQNNQSDF
ncbi:MAG: tetratricopeptide repeat protein [Desulfobacteraceae bacterium]|nr:tetratricopeptide repeat protein [Desulfobacteraceae bacterium]